MSYLNFVMHQKCYLHIKNLYASKVLQIMKRHQIIAIVLSILDINLHFSDMWQPVHLAVHPSGVGKLRSTSLLSHIVQQTVRPGVVPENTGEPADIWSRRYEQK